jgi:hypothetical protein
VDGRNMAAADNDHSLPAADDHADELQSKEGVVNVDGKGLPRSPHDASVSCSTRSTPQSPHSINRTVHVCM